MKLFIDGYRSDDEELLEPLSQAVWYFGLQLLGGRMSRHITLDLQLTENLKEKTGGYGFTMITGEVDKPREFEIELDVSKEHSIPQIITWTAHEMTHLRQFVRGELVDYEDGQVQWKDKTYDGEIEHSKAPWEREAYKMEDKLWFDFQEYYYER